LLKLLKIKLVTFFEIRCIYMNCSALESTVDDGDDETARYDVGLPHGEHQQSAERWSFIASIYRRQN